MATRTVRALTIWMNADFVGTWRIKSGVDEWLANLPEGFPTDISDKIFAGIKAQANKLSVHS
jgi:hypothetical protein